MCVLAPALEQIEIGRGGNASDEAPGFGAPGGDAVERQRLWQNHALHLYGGRRLPWCF